MDQPNRRRLRTTILLAMIGLASLTPAATAAFKGKHRTTTTKSVVIAGTTVTLAPGATTVVKLSLNATGRKLRARAHRLTGELTITQTVVGQTSMLSTETVVFKAKSKAKR